MDGFAGALAHTHHFPVADQPHQLDQNNVQLAAVQPDSVHGGFHTGHMAVVVGAPNVDAAVKAALGEFVAVVCDVCGKIGGVAVLTDQHLVFFRAKGGCAIPKRALLVVGQALVFQNLNGLLQLAVVVQLAFQEPLVVLDAVFGEVSFHLRNVARQCKLHQGLAAVFRRCIHIAVAEFLRKLRGALLDVVAVVAVLREFHGVLAFINLQIACFQGIAEFFDLVARVVYIEFAPYGVTRCIQHSR